MKSSILLILGAIFVLAEGASADSWFSLVDPVLLQNTNVNNLNRDINSPDLLEYLHLRIFEEAAPVSGKFRFRLSHTGSPDLSASGGLLKVTVPRKLADKQSALARAAVDLALTLSCILKPADVVSTLRCLDQMLKDQAEGRNVVIFEDGGRVDIEGGNLIPEGSRCRIIKHGQNMIVVIAGATPEICGVSACIVRDKKAAARRKIVGISDYCLNILSLIIKKGRHDPQFAADYNNGTISVWDVRDFSLYVNRFLGIPLQSGDDQKDKKEPE